MSTVYCIFADWKCWILIDEKNNLTESKHLNGILLYKKSSLDFLLNICFCVPGKTENMGLELHKGE